MANPGTYDTRFDRYNVLVGRIALLWADIEFQVNDAIWELANVDAFAGACLTSQIYVFSARMRALISLVHFRQGREALLSEFNKFDRETDALSRKRNRYVHDPAGITKDGEVNRVNVTAEKRVDMSFKPADYEAMEALCEELRDAMIRFRRLYRRALAELPPWPRTQYERSPGAILAARNLPLPEDKDQ